MDLVEIVKLVGPAAGTALVLSFFGLRYMNQKDERMQEAFSKKDDQIMILVDKFTKAWESMQTEFIRSMERITDKAEVAQRDTVKAIDDMKVTLAKVDSTLSRLNGINRRTK